MESPELEAAPAARIKIGADIENPESLKTSNTQPSSGSDAEQIKRFSDSKELLKKQMEAMFQSGDYLRYLQWCNHSNCLQGFLRVRNLLSDGDYWRCLINTWDQSETIYPNTKIWLELFESNRPERHALMTPEERELLSNLPAKVKVYRGTNTKQDTGMSWTLTKETALFFAGYSNGARRGLFRAPLQRRFVITGECKRADIIALINERQENEVIIDFAKVSNKRFESLLHKTNPA